MRQRFQLWLTQKLWRGAPVVNYSVTRIVTWYNCRLQTNSKRLQKAGRLCTRKWGHYSYRGIHGHRSTQPHREILTPAPKFCTENWPAGHQIDRPRKTHLRQEPVVNATDKKRV